MLSPAASCLHSCSHTLPFVTLPVLRGVIRSGSVSPAVPKRGDAEENTTHDTAKRLLVTVRESLAPRLARNRGTGRASHLLGTCLQPSLLASISLSDCTPFRQFWDRIKKMTG